MGRLRLTIRQRMTERLPIAVLSSCRSTPRPSLGFLGVGCDPEQVRRDQSPPSSGMA